ncbi:response regulator, partial [Salinispira pacifica]
MKKGTDDAILQPSGGEGNRLKAAGASDMYTFLIIDDEPVVREGISENIDWESHGFVLVGACRDGREGMHAIEELRPDVVLTDICMPFVDGMELAAFVADRYPETKTILLTGYDEFEYAQEAVRLKVNDFLLKPITAGELRTILDRVRTELDEERRRQTDLDKLRQQLRESLPLLRERFLNRLIQGEVPETEMGRRLSLLELELPGPHFNLLVVDPDSVNSEEDLMSLAIQNLVESMNADGARTVAFRTRREQLAVVLSTRDRSSAVIQALECAELVSERIRRAFDTTVSIGIGSPVTSLSAIGASYRDARTALGQRLVLGPNQIVTVDQVTDSSEGLGPLEEEQARRAVVRALKSGTAEETEEAVSAFVSLYRDSERPIQECHIGMQRLLAELLSAFDSLGITHSQIPEIEDDPFGLLGDLKTLEDMERWFFDLQSSARSVLATRQSRQSVAKAVEAED